MPFYLCLFPNINSGFFYSTIFSCAFISALRAVLFLFLFNLFFVYSSYLWAHKTFRNVFLNVLFTFNLSSVSKGILDLRYWWNYAVRLVSLVNSQLCSLVWCFSSPLTDSRRRNLLLRSGVTSNIRILAPKKESFSSKVEDPQLNMFSETPLGPWNFFLNCTCYKAETDIYCF